MKNLYVKDLKEGLSLFAEDFALKNLKKAVTKAGKPYLDIELSDSTGSIKGKVWSESIPNVGELETGKVYGFDGSITTDSFGTQINVTKAVISTDFVSSNFVPKSKNDITKMKADFEEFANGVKNKHLSKLIWNVLDNDLYPRFLTRPAAYYIHHASEGGLLEHTLDMLEMSKSVKARYPDINYDLLVTGIIFHDLGKIFEYSLGTSIDVTKEGKLLGHVYMGTEYVKSHAQKDIPQDLLDEVLHMIISHQGQLEFGSPIRPKTAEAVALYHLDDASTKINAAYNVIHSLDADTEFAPYHKQLGVELYNSPYLNELVNEDIPF
jgi:3'-5' exoribonuclease